MKKDNGAEPIEYVRGFTNFLGCKIDLSKKPLIPRSETQFWAKKAIEDISSLEGKRVRMQCLDLFSGSGCIGVAVLVKTGILLCDIADSQDKCLKQAKINCQINSINKARYRIIRSNVFDNIKNKYDCIFANPPYVAIKNKGKVGKSVLKYEPKTALFGGVDGLFYINKFLKNAKNYLNKNGRIYMEFSPEQKGQIEKMLKKYKYKTWKFNKDQFNRWRWVTVE